MARIPYMNFPFPFYQNRYRSLPSSPGASVPQHYPKRTSNESQPECKVNNFSNPNTEFKRKNKSNNNNEDYLFDLFGLKIYFDDILLVSLIYFLYSEGVKDDGLFIVLVLLLIS